MKIQQISRLDKSGEENTESGGYNVFQDKTPSLFEDTFLSTQYCTWDDSPCVAGTTSPSRVTTFRFGEGFGENISCPVEFPLRGGSLFETIIIMMIIANLYINCLLW